jgi:hypothetical protein
MTDKNESNITQDHGIREIWEINKRDEATLIKWAKSGDSDAAKTLMAKYVNLKEIERRDKERGFTPLGQKYEDYKNLIEGYIVEAVQLSLKTGDANKGFNLAKHERQRPKATYKEKLKNCSIGYRVAQLIDEYPSKAKAYDVAAKELHVSEEKARHCYEKYMMVRKSQNHKNKKCK